MGNGVTRVRAALALAVAAVSLAVVPAAGGVCSTHVRLPDGWTRIPVPRLSDGPASLTTYDAADNTADRAVVTNGAAIAATVDRGCTWHESTLPAGLPLPEPSSGERALTSESIRQVRFAIGSANVVWAIGEANLAVGGVVSPQPRVLHSDNGGVTFTSRAEGLPDVGRPLAVRALGAYAYLLFEEAVPGPSVSLYHSIDGGLTWAPLWTKLAPLHDLTVDAFAGLRIWAWGEHGLYTGKATDTAPHNVTDVSGSVSAVDIDGVSGIVRVFLTSGGERFVSHDAGRRFGRLPSPEGVESATSMSWQPGLSVVALSSMETNVLVEPPVGGVAAAVDYSPRGENVSLVQFVGALDQGGFPLYTFSASALYLRIVPLDLVRAPDPPKDGIDVDVRDRRVEPLRASIAPAGEVVSLRQGQRRVVDYTVSLPPVPTPLDVFFMTDSTSSMSTTIRYVQQGVQDIVDSLTKTGIDLFFGVADFRDYPQNPRQTDNHPYRLHRKVGPVNSRLAAALEAIDTGGGTDDGDDSALEAIYQAATGAGRTDPLLVRGELVAPGQDAGFREDSMKVILVATDDGMRQPQGSFGYPGPALFTVQEELVDRGIYLVGLEVVTDTDDGAREEMEELARATGALAPPGGIDCDGDGRNDIRGRGPLVCEFDPYAGSYVADAFVGMLNGIEDVAAVDLSVAAPGTFVRPRGTTHYPRVNVRAPNTFTLPVEFTCTAGNAGTRTPVRIAARSRGDELVATTATLDCAAPEAPDRLVPPPFLALPVVAPPVAPLAPVSHPQPPVNTNPNPQLNPNSGMAAQEDQEIQLAFANTDGVLPDDEELAMTGLAWGVALAMTAAAAFGACQTRAHERSPSFVTRPGRRRPPQARR